MKTLKQAAMQFASDLRNNRCFKAAYNDALLDLDREDLNAIVQCTYLLEPKRTLTELDKLIKKIEAEENYEFCVFLDKGNGLQDVRIFKSEREALDAYRILTLYGFAATLEKKEGNN
ncbi:hypothetical protein PDN92_08195 [Escherichia coli]|uniref:hypothetical protein n=1 Tax=Escherichia coli TaxID=562 RepID=UPI001C6F3045|nr:hypothetical protein [Escherichia coli]EKE1092086.1 hypothetical protein [Salmonella enterica subsp. enterica serovar Chester]MBW8986384.1 hypothetical protein [Escherichia coli]MDA5216963.1 hypothetical protein [Escherichia coli]MDM9290323.1 hypothetical protein [Escherichia coli]WJW49696.1 hypothetical protein QVM92_25020 [Escherichia coli]